MARARSFGSIRKLPSGKYQARYWHLGKQIAAEHTFAAKTDARRWLSTVEADIVRGDWVDPDAGKITFGEYANWWIEQRPVRPRTKQIYEGQLKHITPTFAGVSLCDIRPIDVRGWHGELSREARCIRTRSRRSTDCSARSCRPPSRTTCCDRTRCGSRARRPSR